MISLWPRRRPPTLGRQGENAAVRYLRKQGFKIIERNAKLGPYEIDIIAREGDTIAFVEVKTRRSDDFADPEVNVTPAKEQHIRKAARRYMERHDDGRTYFRYDIVSVVLPDGGKPRTTLIRDAFQERPRRP